MNWRQNLTSRGAKLCSLKSLQNLEVLVARVHGLTQSTVRIFVRMPSVVSVLLSLILLLFHWSILRFIFSIF